jgi:hypothetical protein
MSLERSRFEAELRKDSPDWTVAVDNLNALSMPEMLATLMNLSPAVRADVLKQVFRILGSQRGWSASVNRIDFAMDVVSARKITSWAHDVLDAQVEDARNFLVNLLSPRSSQAERGAFSTPDAAAIAALVEINPVSIAINREFAGSIYKSGQNFGFTRPKRGNERDSDPDVPVPAGSKAVGNYHTHGNGVGNKGAEFPSGDDIMVMKRLRRLMYIGTPAGKIKKATPTEILPENERDNFPLGFKYETLR